MKAIKGKFDGKQIILNRTPNLPTCPVIVVFNVDSCQKNSSTSDWMSVQESALNKVWDNDEDAIYDQF